MRGRLRHQAVSVGIEILRFDPAIGSSLCNSVAPPLYGLVVLPPSADQLSLYARDGTGPKCCVSVLDLYF